MKSPIKIEGFAWWLAQDRDGRRAASIAAHFGIPVDTAEKWRSAFGKELARVAGETVETHLRQYRAEYEVLQSRTIGVLPKLLDAIEANTRKIAETAESGGVVDPGLIAGTASALKTVYSLAEQASGADVAKRRASQKPTSGATGDGKLALPDLGAFFLAESVELETLGDVIASEENGPCNETGNESGFDGAAMPEK